MALGFILSCVATPLSAQSSKPANGLSRNQGALAFSQGAPVGNQAGSAFARYSGYRIRSVSFSNAQRIGQDDLLKNLPAQPGDILDRDRVDASIRQLFATGRFRTLAAEVNPYPDHSLDLIFVVDEKLFIGSIVVYGAPRPPAENQLVNGSKLQLGQQFDEDAVAAGIERMKGLLGEAGYLTPTIRMDSSLDPQHQRIGLNFIIERGRRARVGQIIVNGDPGYAATKIRKIAKLKSGQPVTAGHLSRALNRLRKKYQERGGSAQG